MIEALDNASGRQAAIGQMFETYREETP